MTRFKMMKKARRPKDKDFKINFAILVGLALQFVVVYCPGVNVLFKFTPLSFTNLVICLGLSLLICVYAELFKNDDKNNK